MVKILTIILEIGAIGFLMALISILLLLYDSATNQIVPLVFEDSLLIGTIIFLMCAILSSLIWKIEESTAV